MIGDALGSVQPGEEPHPIAEEADMDIDEVTTEELRLRLVRAAGLRLAGRLTDEELDELRDLLRAGGEARALAHLERSRPATWVFTLDEWEGLVALLS